MPFSARQMQKELLHHSVVQRLEPWPSESQGSVHQVQPRQGLVVQGRKQTEKGRDSAQHLWRMGLERERSHFECSETRDLAVGLSLPLKHRMAVEEALRTEVRPE